MNKNPVDNISGMSYDEKLQLLKLLEEKEKRIAVGGHLMKLFPDEGPYAWYKYPRHMQFIEAGTRHRERFFMGANRCLAEGTLVATPRGPVAIEKIKVGDYVYDRYGNPTKVMATWDNGVAETVSMQYKGKEYLRCTPNHEILAQVGWQESRLAAEEFNGTFVICKSIEGVLPHDNMYIVALSPKKGKKEKVYDITVEHPEHLYMLYNGMVVSNCGKSELGCFELCCHLTGQYPKWWMGKTFDGPIDAWCASDTNATTRDILQYKLLGPPGQFGTGLLASNCIENVKMKAGVPDGVESVKVKHKNGGWSYLGFKSYDQGRKTFQGTARHVVLLDEEPPLDIMAECLIRTMTVEGIVMITATPLKGLTPLVQEFLETAEKPHTDDEVRA